MSDANYPKDLLYHPEHDWARIEGDGNPAHPEATLGITWYAQDCLGEIVFCEPPSGRDPADARATPTPRSSR